MQNENDEAFTDLLSLNIQQETSIAGVTVATGMSRIAELPTGEGQIEVTATKSHALVPNWWAAHLRNGERSVIHTELNAEADLSVTTLPLVLDDRVSTVETTLLTDLNTTSRQAVTDDTTGQSLFISHKTSAEWIDPTPTEATVLIRADVENIRPVPLTLREFNVQVELNDVALTDARLSEEYVFILGERKSITLRFPVDNSQMAAWWPTHIRNGERSTLDSHVTATVSSRNIRGRQPLEFLSATGEITTNLLDG
ncbi:hypothetical protein [Haloplanus aerogenes]|uniref:LEA14-like dessication related protein n=1 Tax=Haloplanus aerogenes TaxID=660522 RepID=A0A3G8QQP5_9EURY|nr:hypothetical protein [Haloplanus aerogenes]AZH24786.1 hypothetical protein DU502_05065 [Haloplanus aerogenes]